MSRDRTGASTKVLSEVVCADRRRVLVLPSRLTSLLHKPPASLLQPARIPELQEVLARIGGHDAQTPQAEGRLAGG